MTADHTADTDPPNAGDHSPDTARSLILGRREVLFGLGAAMGAVALGGAASGSASGLIGALSVDPMPTETLGPYPADGSNGIDVLGSSAIRRNIRRDLDGTHRQTGLPLRLRLRLIDASTDTPLAGAYLYIWHCNADGEYSAYGANAARSWLRGAQKSDADGFVVFDTIVPGRYPGRAAHIHLAVYPDASFDTSERLLVSQLAFRDERIDAIYASRPRYASALRNDTDNADDGVFSDSVSHQLLRLTQRGTGYLGRARIGV